MELAAGNRIFKVPLAGGPSVRIAESGARNSWGDNGTIVFARENTLWTVPDAGGTPTSLTRLDSAAGDVSHQWPHVLPGSKGVLFEISSRGGNVDTDELAVATLPDGKITRLGIRGSNPRYVRSGHLLFTRQDGTVSAVPFDLRRMRVSGAAVTVLDNIVVKTGGAGMYSVSNTGTLAYIEGGSSFMVGLVDRTGRVTRLTRTNGRYFHARIDPSGERVAVALRDGTASDVWILSLRTSEMFRLTRDGLNRSPEWIAGGAQVAWIHSDSTRDEIRAQAANGGGSPHTIQTKFTSILELAAAPRGDVLAAVGGITGQRSIALVSVTGATPERQLIDAGYGVYAPSISPDGRWIAFTGTVSGRSEIFVASIANPAERLQVSTNSGFEPVWAPDGRSLTYRVANRFVSAALSFLPAFEVARRDTVLVDSFNSASAERSYDVDRRTGQWLITKQGDATRDRIVVVTGWLDELKERMASAGRR
jgi:serine/threonine-protein kinase